MKKILLFLGIFIISAESFATTCTPGTVASSGGYSFSLTNIAAPSTINPSIFYAGRMIFNGGSALTVSGVESQAGFTRTFSVNGTYTLPSTCVLTVTFALPSSAQFVGKTFTVSVFLDRMDTVPAVNVAYHGNAVFRTNIGMSGTGEIDRSFGKF